jgi:hypothetical protein
MRPTTPILKRRSCQAQGDLWNAPAERSGDGAFVILPRPPSLCRPSKKGSYNWQDPRVRSDRESAPEMNGDGFGFNTYDPSPDPFTFRAHQAVAKGTVIEVTMVQVATSIVAEGAIGA